MKYPRDLPDTWSFLPAGRTDFLSLTAGKVIALPSVLLIACKFICFKELRLCRTSSKSPRFLCIIKLLKETHHRSFDKETTFLVTGCKRNKCSCPYMTYSRSPWISGDLDPTSVSGWQPDHQEPWELWQTGMPMFFSSQVHIYAS